MLEEVIIPEVTKLVRQNGIINDAPVSETNEFDLFKMLNDNDPITGVPYSWKELMNRLDDEGLYENSIFMKTCIHILIVMKNP